MHIEFLFGVFIALNILDIYTTHRVLKLGGSEQNKFAAKIFDIMGFWIGALLMKGALIGAYICIYVVTQNAGTIMISLVIGCLYMAWIFFNNVRAYNALK